MGGNHHGVSQAHFNTYMGGTAEPTYRLGKRTYADETVECRTCKCKLPPGTTLNTINHGWTGHLYQCEPCETEDDKPLEPMDA